MTKAKKRRIRKQKRPVLTLPKHTSRYQSAQYFASITKREAAPLIY